MAGFDPLSIIAPDLYAKQLAIQRKQMLGQQLLGAGMENPSARYSGLASAGRNILGALLARSGDEDLAALYAPPENAPPQPMAAQTAAPPSDSGQISNSADGPGTSGSPAQAPSQPSAQAMGAALPGNAPQQPPAPRTIPNVMSQALPDLPGLNHTQSMLEYFQSPQTYWQALAPTSEYRNALMATGGDAQKAQQLLLGAANKSSTINLRPGGAAVNYADNSVLTLPNANGVEAAFPNGIGGQAQMRLAPGAASALAQSQFAQNVPKAMLTPASGFDQNGQPVATNQLQMSGNGPAAGLIAPGLGQGSSGFGNTGGLSPQIPAQQQPFLAGQGKAAQERFNGTITEAEGSPDRQNVLGNIIQLSASGVPTGPTSEWLAHLQGVYGTYFPNSKAADNASRYQELTKFAYQNAIRAWQVAGGTGTDNQMEAQMHANVNNQMNPKALQGIAKWALAGEKAVMGKANAQQTWLSRFGNTPQQQTNFENAWRNAMDRKAYILQGMSPQEQAQFVRTLSPQQARDLMQKRQQLKALGGL